MNNCVIEKLLDLSKQEYQYSQQKTFQIAQILDTLDPGLKTTKLEKLMFLLHIKQEEEKNQSKQKEDLPQFENIFAQPKPKKKVEIEQEQQPKKNSERKDIKYGKRSQFKKKNNEQHNEVGDNQLVSAWDLFESKRNKYRKNGVYKNRYQSQQNNFKQQNFSQQNKFPNPSQNQQNYMPPQKRPKVASSSILLKLKYDDDDDDVDQDQDYLEEFQQQKPYYKKYNPPQKRILNKNDYKGVSNVTNKAHQSLFKKQIKSYKKDKEELSPLHEFAQQEGLDINLVDQIEHEILLNKPDTKWEDIIGLKHVKELIFETIIYPLKRPDIFKGLRQPSKGILLFGPPGTGKTLIGKAIASQLDATFFSISSSSLVSKWVGESERLIKTLFAIARFMQPSVIFVDEVDSMLSVRGDSEMDAVRRIKTEFFVQLDGAKTLDKDNVVVIGTTNRPEQIDEAARRRFVKRIYIPLPVVEARIDLIKNLMSQEKEHGFKIELSSKEFDQLEKMTEGYSCADIHQVMKEASMEPVRELIRKNGIEACETWDKEKIRPMGIEDIKSALKRISKSVGNDEIERYKSWNKIYGTSFN